ncbi:(2Fe-2S)-binding protein [Leisingera sp.]|uniref:(2Fe-2S)-binding protein n=1 Tax=Leisingera sp. TaxID=1879318 RepID=UPI002B270BB7|nr:(2Fe-2S)-binding protein [Leisingera sp.]
MAGASKTLHLTVNGTDHELSLDPHRTLLDILRSELGLTGPKYGCGMAQCGACTVLVDGAPARACVMRAGKVGRREIITLEGLADRKTGDLHPVQAGFVAEEGAQCGYCLNGMVMSAVALLQQEPHPDEARIRAALAHNLCRCGTHKEIIASVLHAARLMAAKPAQPEAVPASETETAKACSA